MPLINNINQLNDRIDIISKQPSDGPEPGEVETTLFSCWTYVKTRTLNDIKSSTGTIFEDTIDFVIRYDQKQEITSKMMVKWKNSTYEIIKVNPDSGNKQYTVIVAKETK